MNNKKFTMLICGLTLVLNGVMCFSGQAVASTKPTLANNKGHLIINGENGESIEISIADLQNYIDGVAGYEGDMAKAYADTQIEAIPNSTTTTDGFMSKEDKEKLDGISSGAGSNVQADWDETDTTSDAFIKNKPNLNLLATQEALTTGLNGKVDVVAGKGLSTEDFSTAEKTKLAGLSNYTLPTASNTTLGGIKVGTNLSIDGTGILSADDTTYTLTQGNGDKNNKITLTSSTGSATTLTLPKTTVVDNLTSTSAADALSARQGKVLNEKIDNKIKTINEADIEDDEKGAVDINTIYIIKE